MRVCVVLEHRFNRTPDGAVWTRSNFHYEELSRYLAVFDDVRILARVRDIAEAPEGGIRADGDRVSFWPLPYYVGFGSFCRQWIKVRRAMVAGVGAADAVILKASAPLSSLLERALHKQDHPFAVEVVGDPRQQYSKGAVRHPFRALFRALFTQLAKAQCRDACAVSYVTRKTLQQSYPAHPGAFQSAFSDAMIPARFLASQPRRAPTGPLKLIAVGTLDQHYKGFDILIGALRICVVSGMDLRLTIVGDGRYRAEFTALARKLGIDQLVKFSGALPAGEKVFDELDRHDLFVLPSRTEGMPRAMIEAMARALPCIGSAVGGIPELLDEEDLVPPGDVQALAGKILEVRRSPDRLERMSYRCLERAHAFEESILNARRREFLAAVRDATEMETRRRLDGRPRVLQVLTRLGAGGPPLCVILLTRQLNRLGYYARLATGHVDDADLDMSYLLAPDDPVDFVPEMSRSVSLKEDAVALWRLVRLMRKFRPTVVHTHTAKAGALGRVAARLAGVPVVVHTFHGHVFSGYFPPRVSFAIRCVERILARLADAICVLAPQQARDLVQRFHVASEKRVRVVPLGLELESFRKLPRPAPSGGYLTVAWLGRFVEIKNLSLLIRIMEETFRRSGNIRFVVAGDGTQRALMEAATERWGADRLTWLGWQKDVEGVLAQCDVLIQTSLNEGTPIALIQGMAAGRPFVSTAAGGVVDMVVGAAVREHEGCRWFANAVLAEPDPGGFAACLCELAEHPEWVASMGREAERFAAERYGLEACAATHDALFTELMARKSKKAPLPARPAPSCPSGKARSTAAR